MEYFEVEKPVVSKGLFKHDNGNLYYSDEFLESLASSKDVKLEWGDHGGDEIGEVKGLEYRNGKLYAKMLLPEDLKDKKVGFSIEAVPTQYDVVDLNTFTVKDGVLNSIVVTDGEVRDKSTITILDTIYNTENSRGDSMSEDIAKEYGELKAKYESTLKKIDELNDKLKEVNAERDKLIKDLKDKDAIIKEYDSFKERQKLKFVEKLVEDESDPLRDVYMKLEIDELEILYNKMKEESKISTPPKGLSADVESEESEESEESSDIFDYQEFKKKYGLT